MREHPYREYALLTALYNVLFFGITAFTGGRRQEERPLSPMDLLLMSLATYRLSRLLSYDKVTSWVRAPLVEVGKGAVQPEEVQEAPTGTGARLALGELITCSWCSAMWIAQLLFHGLRLVPRLTRPFVALAAVGGASELLDALFGLIHWTTARVRTS